MMPFRLTLLNIALWALFYLAPVAFTVSVIAAVVCKVMKKKIKPFVISGAVSLIIGAFVYFSIYVSFYNVY